MSSEADIPADSPLRTFTKRNLPASLASTYRHGHISGHPRAPAAQRALERRRNAILRAMDAAQIAAAYDDATRRINALLDEDRRRHEELDREKEKLTAQRQLERKLFWRQKEEKAAKGKGGGGSGGGSVVKEEAEP